MKQDHILEMYDIEKKYPGVKALDKVDLLVKRGSVHCIIGENGAGKSTLIKILTCAEKMNGGSIILDGKPFVAKTIKEAMKCGISTLFQELNIVNQLSVAENLILGREKHTMGILAPHFDYPVFSMMKEFAPDIPLEKKVSTLSYAQKQIVEIVRSIGFNAKIVIMDEPTAALSIRESQRLYNVVAMLKERRISVIYISHVLEDIFTIGDEVTVLRDGKVVGVRVIKETTRQELVKMMVGKVVHQPYTQRSINYNNRVLEVKNLTTSSLSDVSFSLHKGEILGFYGLRGAGKSEVARALFGLDNWKSGEVFLHQQPVDMINPEKAIHTYGLAMVPEERLSEGLFMSLSVSDNIVITNLKKFISYCIFSERKKQAEATRLIQELHMQVHSPNQKANTLSGGNQQKVVIAKCLHAETKILLLDEPSRGIDVGAKEEIYTIIRELASSGSSIIIFSSEYEEIASLCDRVVLMVKGQISTCLDHEDLDSHTVHNITMGV